MVLGTVLRMGYQQSKLDNCMFFKNDDKGLHLIVLYVDDIIIISGDDEECRRMKLGSKRHMFKILELASTTVSWHSYRGPVSHEMLTAVVGVGIQNPHRGNVGSQLLTSLIIIFKLKG
jgi:hypothetical protein